MEAKVNNSEEQRKIRRSQSTLVIVGTGIMMFGVWTAVKSFSIVFLRKEETVQDFLASSSGEGMELTPTQAFIAVLVMTAAYVAVELAVRVFIGKSAVAEGRGLKTGRAYIIWTYILMFFTLLAILLEIAVTAFITAADLGFLDFDTGDATQGNAITAMIIDTTSMIMMIQMLISAGRVRRYKKQQSRTEAGNAA